MKRPYEEPKFEPAGRLKEYPEWITRLARALVLPEYRR